MGAKRTALPKVYGRDALPTVYESKVTGEYGVYFAGHFVWVTRGDAEAVFADPPCFSNEYDPDSRIADDSPLWDDLREVTAFPGC